MSRRDFRSKDIQSYIKRVKKVLIVAKTQIQINKVNT